MTIAAPARRGVLGGLVLMAVGFAYALAALGVSNASSYLFLLIGFAFLVAHVTSVNPNVYLIPTATLLGLSLGLLVPTWLGWGGDPAAVAFLAILAIAFALAYVVRRERRWPLIPAAVLAIVAIAFALAGGGAVFPEALQRALVPTLLLAVGAYLVFSPRAP